MTPAITLVKKNKVFHKLHKYQVHPSSSSYGEEAARELGIDPHRVFKTLVVEIDQSPLRLAVAIIPVSAMLNLKLFAKSAGVKNALMAKPEAAQRATGYVLGGISPFGQKQQLLTIVDKMVYDFPTLFVSAGKRGLQIELKPEDLIRLTRAKVSPIAIIN